MQIELKAGDVISNFRIEAHTVHYPSGDEEFVILSVYNEGTRDISIVAQKLDKDGNYDPDGKTVEASLSPGYGNEQGITVIRKMKQHMVWFTPIIEKITVFSIYAVLKANKQLCNKISDVLDPADGKRKVKELDEFFGAFGLKMRADDFDIILKEEIRHQDNKNNWVVDSIKECYKWNNAVNDWVRYE